MNSSREARINLLPEARQRALARDYWLRLFTVVAALLSLLTLIAGVLLLPTYRYLVVSGSAKDTELSKLKATPILREEAQLAARLDALSRDAAALRALAEHGTASKAIEALLAVPRAGIALTAVGYVANGEAGAGRLTITGAASTREALRAYQLALADAAFAERADLPVSAYAKDANIPFTITIMLADTL